MTRISELPDARAGLDLPGRPAVFLDYDGVLTPIVDRPEDARMDDAMRAVVSALAGRATVCVVSGRDRAVVQELSGLDDLIVAGSHGWDIWSPDDGEIDHGAGVVDEALVASVRERLDAVAGDVEGASVEPKQVSVAIHFRGASEDGARTVRDAVDALLAEHDGALKVTPGKMVLEVQPNVDWDKGRAVLFLLETLGLDGDDVTPVYLGDDHTDEHAFAALAERGNGVGVVVADAQEPDRETAAAARLRSVDEVRDLLDGLAR